MYSFQDFSVFINNLTGIIAQNVTVSNSNTLNYNSTFGARNSSMIPAGPVKNEISIDYIPKILSDPFLTEIQNVDNIIDNNLNFQDSLIPFVIQVGNISGSFYLNNYRVNIQQNNITTSSATFIGFGELSGYGNPKTAFGIASASDEIAHAWTTTMTDENEIETDKPIYGLDFSFSRAINPIYKIGSKEPIQIISPQVSKSLSIVLEDLYTVDFTGKAVGDVFGDKTYLKIQGYSYMQNEDSQDGFSGSGAGLSGTGTRLLSAKGMKITKSNTQAQFNDIVRTTIQAELTV